MKALYIRFLILLSLLSFSFNSMASVGFDDVKRLMPADYILNVDGDTIKFSIDSDLKVQMDIVNEDYEGILDINQVKSTFGTPILPIVNLSLNTGSDEESMTYVVRVSFEQNGKSVLIRLIDIVKSMNDGPNEISTLYIIDDATLLRKSKNGKFVEIRSFGSKK